MRPRYGKMQVIGGWAKVIDTALTGTCRNAISWVDLNTQSNIAFGTHSALMVLQGDTLADITPSGLAAGNIDRTLLGFGMGAFGAGPFGGGPLAQYYPRTWSLATWGENLMAVPRGRGLYTWTNNTSSVATRITQAPTNIHCMLVNSYRQVMVFGCNEVVSGDYNPMCIRGSDFEDNTSWTPSTSNNSFEATLEGGGKIIMAAAIGSYIAVWTDTSLFLGTYTANALAPWRFDLVAKNCGLLGPNAVVVVNQAAYWISPDLQFFSYQLGAPPQPIACPIREDFKDNIDLEQSDKIACTSISEFGEVWWLYPDSRDGNENSRYVAVSMANPGEWFRGDIARTAAIDGGSQRYPLMVSPDSYAYYHENGADADGDDLDWFVTIDGQYLSEAQNRMLIRGMWPDFESQAGNISMTVEARSYPQATASTKGPYTLAVGREKRDFMIDTRIAGVTFAGTQSGTRLGKPTFDVVASGER